MESLLPSTSGLFEKALETSWEQRWMRLETGADAIVGAKFDPPPSYLPFLTFEYGLGELTPYIQNLYTLIVDREGVKWQRIRGTPASVYKGLGWIGHSAVLEDAWHGREYWNSTQLRFDTLPAQDFPDLESIEGITRLSLPLRSDLRRGVYQYDVSAAEADRSLLDCAMLDCESGVAVTPAGTLWSFGRTTEIQHTLTEAEGLSIGNWIEVPGEDGLAWAEMQYPWVTATFPWADNPANQRRALMAAWFAETVLYATLRDQDGEIIGHRRCRAVHPVVEKIDGCFEIGGVKYLPESGGRRVYIEAMTDFEDAADVEATSVEITVGGERAEGVGPGKLWLQPEDLSGGSAIAVSPVSIPLRATVRDQIKILLRF